MHLKALGMTIITAVSFIVISFCGIKLLAFLWDNPEYFLGGVAILFLYVTYTGFLEIFKKEEENNDY